MASNVRRRGRSPDQLGFDCPSQQLRLLITRQAAKLIAEGLTDYHAAKLKAARQLNCDDKNALPDNQEIEAALREHLQLFAADTQPQALAALRHVALRAMRWLQIEGQAAAGASMGAEFVSEPWISGAVLNGTANEYIEIELELIGIEAKTMEFILLNRGVEFELQETSSKLKSYKRTDSIKPVEYHLEFEEASLVVTLYQSHAQRQALCPTNSIKHERAKLNDAEILFALKTIKP